MSESLILKWGSLKGWELHSEVSMAALQKYFDAGTVSMSAALQRDNADQKTALLDLIDVVDCETVCLDWDGKNVSKDKAKEYILNYGKES